MKCPRCKADNRRGAIACWQCYGNLTEAGAAAPVAALSATMPLPVAQRSGSVSGLTGAPAEGPSLTGAPSAPSRPRTQPVASSSAKKLPIVPIILALLVLGGGGTGAFLYMKSKAGDPSKVVKDFFDAFAKQDLDAMAKCCTSSSASQFSGPQAQAAKGFLALIKIENVETLGTTFEGDTAKVRFKAKATFMGISDPNPKETTATLAKENGEWKLDAQKGVMMGGGGMGGGGMGGMGGGLGKGRLR